MASTVFFVAFAQGGAQVAAQADDAQAISARIGKLRQMPDEERAKATKEIALEIRRLPKGQAKLSAATSLSYLSTEGDFGRDTLQEVTDTLAAVLAEQPIPRAATGEIPAPYLQLAQLARYEGMKVSLNNDLSYKVAVVQVAETARAREDVDFSLKDLDGKTWKLSDLKGKVVLVNMWATWCPPCRKEMPDLVALSERFKDQGLVVLAISDEEDKVVRPYVAEHKLTFPVLLDPGRKVNEAYRVDGIPKTFVYDRKGKLVIQTMDMRTQKQFLDLLARVGLK